MKNDDVLLIILIAKYFFDGIACTQVLPASIIVHEDGILPAQNIIAVAVGLEV